MHTPAGLTDLPYAALLQPHAGALVPDARYDTVHFDRVELAESDGAGSRFLECAVTDCVVSGGSLRAAVFNEVWLHGSRFVGAGLADSDWQDCAAESCVLAGTQAYGARLRRVVFRRCKFDSVNLREAALREVRFEDCVLRDVDLSGARLTEVSFPGCALERLRLTGARLSRVDLRRTDPLDLADGWAALRGATISTGQLLDMAPALARELGVTVRDGEAGGR